ncbi:MAG: type IV pilin-like G/H family protein [Cyanobacteria bacterium P01_E01_bin.42]
MNSQRRFDAGIIALLYWLSIYAGHSLIIWQMNRWTDINRDASGYESSTDVSGYAASDNIYEDFDIVVISRAQQAYFLEKKTFARRIIDLRIARRWNRDYYHYRMLYSAHPQPSIYPINLPAIVSIAYPKYDSWKVQIGIVQATIDSNTKELTTQAYFCRSVSSFGVLKSEGDLNFGFPDFADFRQTEPHFACPVNFENFGR